MLLTEIAVSQHRVSQLQDQLSPQRQAIAECESRIRGLQSGLRSAAEGISDQKGELLGPRVKFEARAAARGRLAAEQTRLPGLHEELLAIEKERDELNEHLVKHHARRKEIEQAIDAEMKLRVNETMQQATMAASTSRDACREARQKLWRIQTALTQIEKRISAVMIPAKPQERLDERAADYLASGEMPAERPEVADERKQLFAELRTLTTALAIQTKVLYRAQRDYGAEMAKGLRPRQAVLATIQSDGLDAVRAAALESELLRLAASIEVGDGDTQISVRFDGISPDYQDNDDQVRRYQNRLRLAGLLV
jgi:chromosome segregation ATPase